MQAAVPRSRWHSDPASRTLRGRWNFVSATAAICLVRVESLSGVVGAVVGGDRPRDRSRQRLGIGVIGPIRSAGLADGLFWKEDKDEGSEPWHLLSGHMLSGHLRAEAWRSAANKSVAGGSCKEIGGGWQLQRNLLDPTRQRFINLLP